ncbi:MAG: hypothetical protein AB2L21_05880 [Anaerolineaceae bacterium]|jgi:hypothetical protein
MKKALPLIVAVACGLFVLLALMLQPNLGGFLNILLNWAIILTSMAVLVAIATFLLSHLRRIAQGKKGFIYSLTLIATFLISFISGILLGVDDPGYLKWIASIQVPLETSLLGLAALVMTSAAVQVFRNRGWSPLTVSFGISALVFLLLSLGILQALQIPQLDVVIGYLQELPIVGARGLLIGIGIGALLAALRVLFGMERPYGD